MWEEERRRRKGDARSSIKEDTGRQPDRSAGAAQRLVSFVLE